MLEGLHAVLNVSVACCTRKPCALPAAEYIPKQLTASSSIEFGPLVLRRRARVTRGLDVNRLKKR